MFRYLAEDIAFLLIKNKIVDIEKRDIYVYGLEAILLNLLNILTALTISILSNTMLHFGMFMLIFIPLRLFIGGYHAKTSESCYVITTTIYILTVLAVKFLPDLYCNIPAIITLIIFIIPIIALAPAENTNNPLSASQRKRNRFISLILTAIDSLIFIMLALNSYRVATSIMIFIAVNSVLMVLGIIEARRLR